MGGKLMPNRRGHGEGSIYQRRDGRWVASVEIGWQPDARGRVVRRRKTIYSKTRREVAQQLQRLQRDIAAGKPASNDRLTLTQYLREWGATHRQTVRASTWQRYEELLRLHVVPLIGQLPLSKLSARDVQRTLDHATARGLSPRSVSHVRAVLRAALSRAVELGLIPTNPASVAKPPRVPAVELGVLSAEQARHLIEAARSERLSALFTLALYTGMRQGELLALHWGDIDWERATVTVRRTVRHMSGRGAVEGEPKSRTSRRTLPLVPPVLAALREHRQQQLEERFVTKVWAHPEIVFASERGTYIEATNLIRCCYRRVLTRAGLPPVHFHTLRHTTASLLAEAGVSLAVAQELLGHSSLAMSRHYTHIPDAMERQAAGQLGRLLEFGCQDGCQEADESTRPLPGSSL